MKKLNLLIILILLIAANLSVNYDPTAANIDIINTTQMAPWAWYMTQNATLANPWEFPIIGFAYSIFYPWTDAFDGISGYGGGILYLILWGVFIMMVWRQSMKITIPALIACITAGAWSLLIPESSQPWCMILLAAAVASQLMTFFAKE
jgi:hypothetical protein